MNWMLLSEAASNAKQWENIMADPDVILIDIDDPTTYSVSQVFSTDDITVTFAGDTIGSLADTLLGLDTTGLNGTKTAKDNNTTLYPINRDFGFIVTDFDGAEQKDFFENQIISKAGKEIWWMTVNRRQACHIRFPDRNFQDASTFGHVACGSGWKYC